MNLFLGGCPLDNDRLVEGQAALQRGRRLSEQLGAKRDLPFYHWALAAGHLWAGDWDDALAECQACLELADEYGMRLHGTVFSHSIHTVIAVHCDDLGDAEQAVAAAERELAATGPQLGSDWLLWAKALVLEARGQPKSDWDSLTGTERKAVQLVAEGLSNPEIAERMFISRGTVHTHVSHILAKLGLRSRVELAAETSRRGL